MHAGAKATARPVDPFRERRGGPLDPRLLRYAHTTRRFIVLAIGIGGATALLVVAQAWLIATVVNDAFFHHGSLSSLPRSPPRSCSPSSSAAPSWPGRPSVPRTGPRPPPSLSCGTRRPSTSPPSGPVALEQQDNGRLTVLVTTGIDALDGYFSRYLPQLFLAVIVPVTIIAVVAGADWISAVLIAVTVPLIPVFMGLVGLTTRDRTAARMRSLQRLAGHFLDVVAGLPTLKVFGRAKAQARAIAEVTDRYRTTTLATLKLTFLSSLILELLATVSVALVAVAVGLRLLDAEHALPRRSLRPGPGARGLPATAGPRCQLPRQRGRDEGGRAGLRAPRGSGRTAVRPARPSRGTRASASPGSRSPTRPAASRPCTAPTSSSSRARRWRSPARAAAASPRSSTSSSGCAAPARERCSSAGWTCATSTSTRGVPASAGYPSGRTSSPVPWPTTSASAGPVPPTTRWRPRWRRPV